MGSSLRRGDAAKTKAYCRYAIVAAAIGAVVLLAAAGLAWTAYLVHVGNLDAMELAAKVATPDPLATLARCLGQWVPSAVWETVLSNR